MHFKALRRDSSDSSDIFISWTSDGFWTGRLSSTPFYSIFRRILEACGNPLGLKPLAPRFRMFESFGNKSAARAAFLEYEHRESGGMTIRQLHGHGPLCGPLNLGVIPTLAPYLLPKLLPFLKSRFETLQLVVHEQLTGHLLAGLQGHQIDAVILSLPLDGDEFEELALFDEPF